jgi:aspartyl/asparaginyl-tRNA synthetase
MNEEHNPYRISYIFHIQQSEEFYEKLREYHRLDLEIELERETDNVDLAQNMLRKIGVTV